MRHKVGHRKLGRVTEHRIAMLRNQADGAAAPRAHRRPRCRRRRSCGRSWRSLITIGQARRRRPPTPRAKTLRGQARSVGADDARQGRRQQAVRGAGAALCRRPGGYTRILEVGLPPRRRRRRPQLIELVGRRVRPEAGGGEGREGLRPATRRRRQKGVGERLRQAAHRAMPRRPKRGQDAAPRARPRRPGERSRRIDHPA